MAGKKLKVVTHAAHHGGKENCNDTFGTRVTLCQECKTGRHVKTGKLFHTVKCIEDHTINSDLHEFLMTAPYKIESIINTK